MTKAPHFTVSLSQDLSTRDVITYFMKVHTLLSIHLHLTLKYLEEGTPLGECAWDRNYPSLLLLLPVHLLKLSFWFKFCGSVPLRGVTESFQASLVKTNQGTFQSGKGLCCEE